MSSTIERVAAFVTRRVARPNLTPTDSLVESGLVDSLMVLEIVSFLEAELDVTLEAEDITLDNFETLTAIALLVDRRRS